MTQDKRAFDIRTCARPNILSLVPYRCARDDYQDDGSNILLDANENAHGPSLHAEKLNVPLIGSDESLISSLRLNRYPDPYQHEIKHLFCRLRNTHLHTPKDLVPENLFVGVGSDEAIDSLMRCFCIPGHDKILICPPTYGMYAVSAHVNDLGVVKVPLLPAPEFQIDVPSVLSALSSSDSEKIKLVYICSPGNPTGALVKKDDIQKILEHPTWNGVVVLDEAYIDFAPEGASLAEWALEWPNLCVIQTLSKAFGLAGIRVGVAFTSQPIAALLNNIKAPYNISSPASAIAHQSLQPAGLSVLKHYREKTIAQRARLLEELPKLQGIGRFRGGTASNFLLVEILDSTGMPNNTTALKVYHTLAEKKGVVVRFRGKEHGCLGCLRITVGTEDEVTRCLREMKSVLSQVREEDVKS
ncbi:Histidinol-phosphate aminotransferase [Podosphaera aphanis]|nr:Histidinol-phosphate aminotransferase [Podosphaera aphanis]